MDSRDERVLHHIKSMKEAKKKESVRKDDIPEKLSKDPFIDEIFRSFLRDIGIELKNSIDGNYDKLKRDYEAMKLCCSHQVEEIERLKEIEENYTNLANTIKDVRKELNQYSLVIGEQKRQLQAASNYTSALEEKCRDLTNERDTLKNQCESFHDRLISLENKLGKYTVNLAKLQTDAEISSSQLDKNNNLILQLEQQLAQAQIEAQKYRDIKKLLQ